MNQGSFHFGAVAVKNELHATVFEHYCWSFWLALELKITWCNYMVFKYLCTLYVWMASWLTTLVPIQIWLCHLSVLFSVFVKELAGHYHWVNKAVQVCCFLLTCLFILTQPLLSLAYFDGTNWFAGSRLSPQEQCWDSLWADETGELLVRKRRPGVSGQPQASQLQAPLPSAPSQRIQEQGWLCRLQCQRVFRFLLGWKDWKSRCLGGKWCSPAGVGGTAISVRVCVWTLDAQGGEISGYLSVNPK